MKKATAFGQTAMGLVAIALGVFGIAWTSSAIATPACGDLATDPQYGLAGNPAIKSVTSAITTTGTVPYCRVTLVYGTEPTQNITIAVGLPLSTDDGGTGGIQGAWNGRTEGLGGGGCAGNLNVNAAVNAGFVGSGTDGGHTGGDCTPGVNADGTYNLGFIEDFFRVGIKQEILWSKDIAATYYSEQPVYNYWNGCSTGGRQGYLLAQELGDQLDGVLANAPAMYWTRFQTAQMWGQIAMRELADENPPGAIASAKLAAVQKAAVAACDANDGTADGIIDDPRTCNFDASANICGEPNAPAAPACLTTSEAASVNKIWDGPRNAKADRIWFPLDRGTDFAILDGPAPFALGVIQFEWNEIDRNFDWKTVSLGGPAPDYPQVAQDGSRNIADVTDTFGPLDTFKKHGGKMLTFVGGNDQFIYPRGVLNYYRLMASRYQAPDDQTGFQGVQSFYRLFHAPGVGHCGAPVFTLGTVGPWPTNGADFQALINWVENGVAPSQVLGNGTGRLPGAVTPPAPLTRPLCPYPQTAEYKGSGDVFDAANWACGGNLETTQVVCPDVLVQYKHEVLGNLFYEGSGVLPAGCVAPSHSQAGGH
ncbi:MAG TPA: tannase/feruloyl esterase family alpha/beta hydrolase [Casimicrobiaceae bacterium]